MAVALAGCGTQSAGGHDLGLDPDLLSELDGKADSNVCADYPGGSLAGDDLLVLVNKQEAQQLEQGWAPADLVAIDSRDMMPGRSGELRYGVLVALESMFDAAAADGMELGVRSAYRSFRTQCLTFDYKVRQHGLEHAKKYSAEPGRSQHQLGTTADITSARLGWRLEGDMGEEPEGQWLAANAWRYGFALSYPEGAEDITGYGYEPWHYRYIGVAAAQELHGSGLLLEEYLRGCAGGDPGLACPREELEAPQPNQGWIGGACASDEDCAGIGGEAFCLRESDGYPGGHCALPCFDTCPDRAGFNAVTFCVAAPAGDLCHSKCDFDLFPDTGCRDGYACVEGDRPSGTRSAMVCLPDPEHTSLEPPPLSGP